MQSRVLDRGEVDQLQEVANTNEAHLDDSYSFSQILLDHHSWPYQTHYFAAMQSTGLHQDERLEEAKELHQNSFQRNGRSDRQRLFLQKPWQSSRNVKDIFVALAIPNVWQDQLTKASFNASIILASSDSIAVLTIGIVIKISLIFYDVRNILKFIILYKS
jgi:hypothetical protein